MPGPPPAQHKLTFCRTLSDASSLDTSSSTSSSRHARHWRRSPPEDPPRVVVLPQLHTPPRSRRAPTSSTPVPKNPRPTPPQPRDLGDVYDLDESLVKFRFSTTATPCIQRSERGVQGTAPKWYYVVVGSTVGIYNEWYVQHPQSCLTAYLSCRANAASAVNGITGSIYKGCDSEYECYRAFKAALLDGHVVVVNTRL